MADGKIVKMEEDYGETVDTRLPECTEMAQVEWWAYNWKCTYVKPLINATLIIPYSG